MNRQKRKKKMPLIYDTRSTEKIEGGKGAGMGKKEQGGGGRGWAQGGEEGEKDGGLVEGGNGGGWGSSREVE